MNTTIFWRWLFFCTGLIILSLGATLTIKGQFFGVGSWDVLHIGLAKKIGLTIGSWSILTGILILVLTSLIYKRLPQIGTFLNLLLVGVFIDIFNWLLPDVESLFIQAVLFVLGALLLGYGCGIYIVANLGAGPRDSLMLLVVDKLGWSIMKARTTMEVSVSVVGFLLGGPVGIGTVFMAFGLGPIIQKSIQLNGELLYKCCGERLFLSH